LLVKKSSELQKILARMGHRPPMSEVRTTSSWMGGNIRSVSFSAKLPVTGKGGGLVED